MNMNKMHLLLVLIFALLVAGACTEVDLYDGPDYTRRTDVTFAYDWDAKAPDDGYIHEVPDSMFIIAKRIVGSWKCAMEVSSLNGSGYYLWNAPSNIEPEPEPEPEPIQTDSTSGGDDIIVNPNETEVVVDTVSVRGFTRGLTRADAQPGVDYATDVFQIIPGTYKFITFNCDTTAYLYQDLYQYLAAEENQTTLQELCMEYKRYEYGDSALRGTVADWKDFNVYGDGKNYIQPDITPIYYDSLTNQRIDQSVTTDLLFKPGLLTQNIDIRFHIRKNVDKLKFTIDSIYADISGIPFRLNLSNDYFDIKTTCKMMFQNYMEDADGNRIKDSDTNTDLYCHGNIDVLSVVDASVSTTTRGPGIMQLMIFVKGYSAIRGMINLYHCIRRANLIDDVGDGVWARKRKNHGVLQIDSDLLIDENLIITEDGDGGLDRWISLDEQEIVIDT